MSKPWKCPECSAWIAPHVSEHRCDPPSAGVPAIPSAPGPAGSAGTSINTTLPGTVTLNVTGSLVSADEMRRRIQRGLLEQSHRNWRGQVA